MSRRPHFLFILLLSLLWVVAGGRQLDAQVELEIISNELLQEFPEQVTFTLEADSPSPIVAATLRYGSGGRGCRSEGAVQPVPIMAGRQVDVSWVWDWQRFGIVPPGTEIWWEWVIDDESGTRRVIERQSAPVADARFVFNSRQERNIELRWIEGDDAFGVGLLRTAVSSLERLENEMGLPMSEPITIVVYPTAADVQEILIRAPEWTGGVAFPRYNSIIVGIAPGQDEWAATVIAHELTHLVVGAITFNCVGIDLPVWLSEGLAEYGEAGEVTPDDATMTSVLANGDAPPLRSLANSFSAYGADASLAYLQSRSVVTYLIAEFGPESLLELLSAMQGGERVDAALLRVYGLDTDLLDAAWRQSMGFAPLPTRRPTPDPARATPVPTIAPFTLELPPAATATLSPTPIPATATTTASPTSAPTALPATEVASLGATPQNTPSAAVDAGASNAAANGSGEPAATRWLLIGILLVGFAVAVWILRARRGSHLS